MTWSYATRRSFLSLAAGAAFGALPAAAQTASPAAAAGAQTDAFDQVWETVRDHFYDAKLHGLDWPAVRERYRPKALAAATRDDMAVVVNTMLAELGASHTHYYTPGDPAYYQLADIFQYGLRRHGLERAFANGEISYPGIGVFTHSDDQGRTFISGAIEGAPAQRGGVLLGDQVLSVDGSPFRAVESFRGKVGSSVSLALQRGPSASPIAVKIAPANLQPGAMFLSGLQASARVITAGKARVGYVHVWSYASRRYQEALEDLIGEGPLRDADALIWDLRDGWGGAQPEYLDLFNPRAPTLLATERDGDTSLIDVKWRKPVAMLINEGTRSGKEVLAYGFKKYGIGPLVGVRTEGAVLAATAYLIGDQGLLLLAVEDVLVDGQRLEGVGVTPTIEVPFDLRFAAGSDPQLDLAVQILAA
jgi:carboxyl-terminal processing protease